MKHKAKLGTIVSAIMALMLLCTAKAFADTLPSDYDSGMLSMNNISTVTEHTVAILADSTVIAVGNKKYGQGNVSDWSNIIDVKAGGTFSVE